MACPPVTRRLSALEKLSGITRLSVLSYDHALNELNAACSANGKSNMLPTYCHWKCQNYVTKLHPTLARIARPGMYDIKCNFDSKINTVV